MVHYIHSITYILSLYFSSININLYCYNKRCCFVVYLTLAIRVFIPNFIIMKFNFTPIIFDLPTMKFDLPTMKFNFTTVIFDL